MTKFISPNSTSGSGFYFEDDISVFFSLKLLLSEEIKFNITTQGVIEAVGLQKRNENWFIDDIILKIKNNGILPITIKKYNVFKSNKINNEVLIEIYKQLYVQDSNNFDLEKDKICIVDNNFESSRVISFLKYISTSEYTDKELKNLLESNKWYRTLFESFREIKIDNTFIKLSNIEIINIIKHLEYLNFDFDKSSSKDYERCIELSLKLLTNHNLNEAKKLISVLRTFIQRYKTYSATITRNSLLQFLGKQFELKLLPQYDHEIGKLIKFSENSSSSLETTIKNIRINREEIVKKTYDFISENRISIIFGDSGSGKSTILKTILERKNDKRIFIWLNYSDLDCTTNNFISSLKLNIDLEELIFNNPNITFAFILEGIDKTYSEAVFTNLRFLMLMCSKYPINVKLVFSSQTDELNRLNSNLKTEIEAKYLQIPGPKKSELSPLIDTLPELSSLLSTPHLVNLLSNFQILKIVIYNYKSGDKLINAVEETDIVEWFWFDKVTRNQNKISIQNVVFKFLKFQNQNFSYEVNTEVFDPLETTIIDFLITNGIFKFDVEKNCILFSHKLVNDWAKFIYIRALNHEELVKLSELYYWKNGLKYFSIYQLKSNFDKWKEIYQNSATSPVLRNALLEGLFSSNNSTKYYEGVHKEIFSKDLDVFESFINLFLYYSTITPDTLVDFGKDLKIIDAELFIMIRIPILPYWNSLLRFILKYKQIYLEENNNTSIIILIIIWLKNTPKNYEMRSELAAIGVQKVQKTYAAMNSRGLHRGNHNTLKLCYILLCYSFSEMPEDIKEIFEIASGKVYPKGKIKVYIDQFNKEYKEYITKNIKRRKRIKKDNHFYTPVFANQVRKFKSFKHGPVTTSDSEFSEFILSPFYPPIIYLKDPYFLNKILLAVIIKENIQPLSSYNYSLQDRNEFGIHKKYNWTYPSFYDSSFEDLLRINSDAFLDFAITLINFFTERYLHDVKLFNMRAPRTIKVKLFGKVRTFIGDEQSLNFYNGNLTPYIVKNVLIVLEKYLIENSKDEKIIIFLKELISKCNNISILGILITFSKCNKKMLLSEFFEIIKNPYLIDWDMQVSNSFTRSSYNPHRQSGFIKQNIEKWYNLPCRKTSLLEMLKQEMYYNPNNSKLATLKKYYEKYYKQFNPADYGVKQLFLLIIGALNKDNYRILKQDEKVYLVFENSNITNDIEYQNRQKQNEWNTLKLTLPFRCQRILEENKSISKEEYSELFSLIAKLKEERKLKDDFDLNINSLFGVYTVLLCKGGSYLSKSNLKKITTELTKLCKNCNNYVEYIKRSDFNPISFFSWQNFASYSIPFIIKNKQIDKKLLECFFNIVSSNDNSSIENLFNLLNAYKIPNEIIFKLANIALELNSFDILRNLEKDGLIKIKELLGKLLSNEIPGRIYNLKDFNLIKAKLYYEENYRDNYSNFGFNTDILRSLFMWMFNGNDTSNNVISFSTELENVIEFYIDIIENYHKYREDNLIPSDFDHWAINILVLYLVFNQNINSQNYFDKFFNIISKEWFVSAFLGQLFRICVSFHCHKQLLDIWVSVINSIVSRKEHLSWREFNILMRISSGIDPTIYYYLTDNEKDILKIVFNITKEYYTEFIQYTVDYSAMINFLVLPISKEFTLESLEIVDKIYTVFFKNKDQVNETTFLFLDYLTSNYIDTILKNDNYKTSYFSILDKLLSIQNHSALKLAEKLQYSFK